MYNEILASIISSASNCIWSARSTRSLGLNGVRPLVCGALFRRLTMSALCKERKAEFQHYLGAENFAVGVKGSLEKIASALGLPFNDKTVGPAQKLTYLGVQIASGTW